MENKRSGRLGKAFVDRIMPEEREIFVWDIDLTGFGVRVSPRGRKTYFVQGRLPGGGTRRVKIGAHGQKWTADAARVKAKSLLREIEGGEDPHVKREKAKAEAEARRFTLETAIDDFMGEHGTARLKASTAAEYQRNWKKHVIPVLGSFPVVNIDHKDIAALLEALGKKSPIAANRVRAQLSKLFNWLEARGDRPRNSNPVTYAPRQRETPRERMLTKAEFNRLSAALQEIEEGGAIPPGYANALRFIVWTGCRAGEAMGLRWEYLSEDRRVCRLPDSKTGAKNLFLGEPVRALLEGMTARDRGPVFMHDGAVINRSTMQHYWEKVREKAKLEGLRIHDLRHAMASVAAEIGLSLQQTGALLGHTRIETTRRYSHLFESDMHAVAEKLSAEIHKRMLEGEGAKK